MFLFLSIDEMFEKFFNFYLSFKMIFLFVLGKIWIINFFVDFIFLFLLIRILSVIVEGICFDRVK